MVSGTRDKKIAADRCICAFFYLVPAVAWLLLQPLAMAETSHEYTSDYFSFVGRDEKGLVAFALDNNRGRAADRYQAEHFVKLYDALQGWVSISGNGDYPNTGKQLQRIPDSVDFSFSGDAQNGWTITSASNGIELSVSPIAKTIVKANAEGTCWLGAAAGTLRWNNRVIRGRVIYEYLHWNRFNRLAGRSPGLFRNFNGFYLMTGEGADVYLHFRDKDRLNLTGKQSGFATWDGPAQLREAAFRITRRKTAPGLYRWPVAWAGRFDYKGNAYRFALHSIDHASVKTWVIGGFAMAVVEGEITSLDGSRRYKVVGLAELIMYTAGRLAAPVR